VPTSPSLASLIGAVDGADGGGGGGDGDRKESKSARKKKSAAAGESARDSGDRRPGDEVGRATKTAGHQRNKGPATIAGEKTSTSEYALARYAVCALLPSKRAPAADLVPEELAIALIHQGAHSPLENTYSVRRLALAVARAHPCDPCTAGTGTGTALSATAAKAAADRLARRRSCYRRAPPPPPSAAGAPVAASCCRSPVLAVVEPGHPWRGALVRTLQHSNEACMSVHVQADVAVLERLAASARDLRGAPEATEIAGPDELPVTGVGARRGRVGARRELAKMANSVARVKNRVPGLAAALAAASDDDDEDDDDARVSAYPLYVRQQFRWHPMPVRATGVTVYVELVGICAADASQAPLLFEAEPECRELRRRLLPRNALQLDSLSVLGTWGGGEFEPRVRLSRPASLDGKEERGARVEDGAGEGRGAADGAEWIDQLLGAAAPPPDSWLRRTADRSLGPEVLRLQQEWAERRAALAVIGDNTTTITASRSHSGKGRDRLRKFERVSADDDDGEHRRERQEAEHEQKEEEDGDSVTPGADTRQSRADEKRSGVVAQSRGRKRLRTPTKGATTGPAPAQATREAVVDRRAQKKPRSQERDDDDDDDDENDQVEDVDPATSDPQAGGAPMACAPAPSQIAGLSAGASQSGAPLPQSRPLEVSPLSHTCAPLLVARDPQAGGAPQSRPLEASPLSLTWVPPRVSTRSTSSGMWTPPVSAAPPLPPLLPPPSPSLPSCSTESRVATSTTTTNTSDSSSGSSTGPARLPKPSPAYLGHCADVVRLLVRHRSPSGSLGNALRCDPPPPRPPIALECEETPGRWVPLEASVGDAVVAAWPLGGAAQVAYDSGDRRFAVCAIPTLPGFAHALRLSDLDPQADAADDAYLLIRRDTGSGSSLRQIRLAPRPVEVKHRDKDAEPVPAASLRLDGLGPLAHLLQLGPSTATSKGTTSAITTTTIGATVLVAPVPDRSIDSLRMRHDTSL